MASNRNSTIYTINARCRCLRDLHEEGRETGDRLYGGSFAEPHPSTTRSLH